MLTRACSLFLRLRLVATSGDPAAVHTFSYASADSLGREGRIAKFTMQNRANQFTSRTRLSMRNSRRYRRTSGTDGESGEPRLTNKTPLLMWNAMVGELKPRMDTNEHESEGIEIDRPGLYNRKRREQRPDNAAKNTATLTADFANNADTKAKGRQNHGGTESCERSHVCAGCGNFHCRFLSKVFLDPICHV